MSEEVPSGQLDPATVIALLHRYESTHSDPRTWQSQAATLRHAARHLISIHLRAHNSELDGMPMDRAMPLLIDQELHRPALMLAAFAIEVLLKAVVIKKGSAVNFENHDLIGLSEVAGLEAVLNKEVLRKLMAFALWKGRYPTSRAKKSTQDHLSKQRKHMEKVSKSKSVTLGDLRPLPGLDLPNALYDYSSGPEDYGGDLAVELFEKAMVTYQAVFEEFQA